MTRSGQDHPRKAPAAGDPTAQGIVLAPEGVAYIGLGANLGNAAATLMAAADAIAHMAGVQETMLSPLYRTAPVDAGGPDYINAVMQAHTTLPPEALLRALQQIEDMHGRQRPYRNAPRTLDLDLLLHGSEVRDSAELVLPHPRMHERAFVLVPLQKLAPGLVLRQGSLQSLIDACVDQRLEILAPD